MKLIIATLATLALSGCATNQLVSNDLDAAIAMAKTYGDTAGEKCWTDLQTWNAQPVKGAFSAWQHLKNAPMLEGCFRK